MQQSWLGGGRAAALLVINAESTPPGSSVCSAGDVQHQRPSFSRLDRSDVLDWVSLSNREGVVNWFDRFVPRSKRKKAKRAGRGTAASPVTALSTREDQPIKKVALRSFPRFKSTALDQLDPKLSDPLAKVRMSLRTAFTPSLPITDQRMFAGRTEVLTSLIGAIEEQRLHVVLYGERGIGKTSLLHVLEQTAREARYLVVYLSCGASTNFDEIFRSIALGVPLLFHDRYGPTSAESERGASFADLLTSSPVSVRLASEMLTHVVGTRVLVILDEFDRCESAEFRRNIAELLKNLSDRSVRVQVVIAGVASNVTELVEYIPSIQRSVAALPVPDMSAREIRQLVVNGEDASGVSFESVAVGLIVLVANGSPYLASLLCHRASHLAIEQGRMTVTTGDVAEAVTEAVQEFESRTAKRSRAQIAACLRETSLEMLGALSSAARSTGGRFNRYDVGVLVSGADQLAKCQALADNLVAKRLLLDAGEDDDVRFYWFVDEGVPPYLRLLAAQARLVAGAAPASTLAEPRASARL
jgi:Cdc6-like AAA superfamily ATPase